MLVRRRTGAGDIKGNVVALVLFVIGDRRLAGRQRPGNQSLVIHERFLL
jgi:hypothetical protein